ncbi:hypothetical protein ASE08_07525 [Rhizobacter sp. Root16D2]|nr:hypothetical protein ASC88_24790 [Rhizobacter sp. Root29]KQW06836.1 hypothetical protein ASC98_25670 [Rhizobacter sp. Root1238]KRB19042.1 hypothetical protein ASE08_07525 [Rhizobacter sp. Root16D2]
MDAHVHGLAYDLVNKILKKEPTMQTIALGSRWLSLVLRIKQPIQLTQGMVADVEAGQRTLQVLGVA